jgi:hypothetical protein
MRNNASTQLFLVALDSAIECGFVGGFLFLVAPRQMRAMKT